MNFRRAIAASIMAASASALAQQAIPQAQLSCTFIQIPESSNQWLGFINGNTEVFFGGCAPLSLPDMSVSTQCRWPDHIAWSIGSPGRNILLLTTQTEDLSTSHIVEADTGKAISRKSGVFFTPPGALHPTRDLWVASSALPSGRGETIAARDFSFKKMRSPKGTFMPRIHALAFSSDGNSLFAAASNYTTRLDAGTWTGSDANTASIPWPDDSSADSTLTAARRPGNTDIIDTATGKPAITVAVDSTRETYPVAFSTDSRWVAIRGLRLGHQANPQYGIMLIHRLDGTPLTPAPLQRQGIGPEVLPCREQQKNN